MIRAVKHQFPVTLSYLREDEEQGGRADQEAGGRAHRDEGAGFQRVGAAGGHPVLSTLISVSYRRNARRIHRKSPCWFVCKALHKSQNAEKRQS